MSSNPSSGSPGAGAESGGKGAAGTAAYVPTPQYNQMRNKINQQLNSSNSSDVLERYFIRRYYNLSADSNLYLNIYSHSLRSIFESAVFVMTPNLLDNVRAFVDCRK